jgi:hypothetical protein
MNLYIVGEFHQPNNKKMDRYDDRKDHELLVFAKSLIPSLDYITTYCGKSIWYIFEQFDGLKVYWEYDEEQPYKLSKKVSLPISREIHRKIVAFVRDQL